VSFRSEDTTGCTDVTDLSSASAVVDLSCFNSGHGRASYWHREANCLIPAQSFLTAVRSFLTADPAAAVILPEYYRSFTDLLATVPPHSRVVHLSNKAQHNRTCFRLGSPLTPVYWTAGDNLFRDEYAVDVFALRAELLSRLPSAPKDSPTLLLVHREHERNFHNTSEVAARLALFLGALNAPPLAQAMYFGNETLAETLTLFRNARAVVAFHGAGTINALVCSPGTVVVELSFLNPDFGNASAPANKRNQVLWRSNHPLWIDRLGVDWYSYTLPIAGQQFLLNLSSGVDVDHVLKSVHDVLLADSDAYNIALILAKALA
jgi:hypothetical protein